MTRALDYIRNEIDDVVLRQIEYADAAKFTVTALLMSDQEIGFVRFCKIAGCSN